MRFLFGQTRRAVLIFVASMLCQSGETVQTQETFSPKAVAEFNTSQPGEESPVQDLGEGKYRIGKLLLNSKERTVKIPTVVNMNKALVEYLIVTDTGKVHESILRTEAKPRDFHVSMLLLGAKGAMAADPSVFYDPTKSVPGDSVTIEVVWTNEQSVVRKPMENFIQNLQTGKPVSKGPWKYNGSQMIDGVFIAQQEGSFVSLISDPYALINNPRVGRENDEIWTADTNNVPALGTAIEVIVKLEKGTQTDESQ